MADSTKPLLDSTSSDKQRMLGALLAALRNHELTSDQLLPAIVSEYDRVNNVAVVQPLIQWVRMDNVQQNRHPLAGINVLSLGGGGFHINFPLKKGDLGWIIASDRDISIFKQSLQLAAPNTGRLHKFEDGWFVPDVFRKYTIDGADSEAMVIQSIDAKTRISISNGVVNITAPTSVTVTTPQATFTGNVTVNKNLEVKQNTTIDQNLTTIGATQLNGGLNAAAGGGAAVLAGGVNVALSATLPASATVGGIAVSGHGHISSSPGNRTAGGMIS